MIYLIYLLLVPISLLLTLIAVILAPVLPVFAKNIYGWCLVTANGLFQFRLVRRIFSTDRCLYINFGWNVIGLVDPNVDPKPDAWQATFVFSPRISGYR